MACRARFWTIALLSCLCALAVDLAAQETIGRWKRFEYAVELSTWQGDPFAIEWQGVFQSPSGRKLEHWGFYAGDRTWKIYFMPDEIGRWSFETTSNHTPLNGHTGEFDCVSSNLPGLLTNDGPHWILSEIGGTMPVIWNPPVPEQDQWGFRALPLSHPSIRQTLQLSAETVGARVLGFDALLIAPIGWASDYPQSAVPYVAGEEGVRFYLPFWDRLNEKLDAARDLGMGHYIMLYSDDELTPDRFGLTPKSEREIRFFRYTLARLACYPIVLWDTGIDIGEYRTDEWIDWFVEWIKENDPWRHPVGSRTGGGSGGKVPAGATYYSTGGATIPSWQELVRSFWGFAQRRSIPVAHTDHWRPFHTRGDWTHQKIRTVHWRCALAGGQALYPDYNQGNVNWNEVIQFGAPWIGHATRFFREHITVDPRDLVPNDALILTGTRVIASASAGREYIVYAEEGGEIQLDLSAATNNLVARWYNPRTGEYEADTIDIIQGEPNRFISPTQGPEMDWVLHIQPVKSSSGSAFIHNE